MTIVKFTRNTAEIPFDQIFDYLSKESYWSKNIPASTLKSAMENSLNVLAFENNEFAGYARIVTDFTTVAYLCDVFVLTDFRNRGIANMMMDEIHSHEQFKGLRRWILCTRDAHALYKKHGWKELENPSVWMNIHLPNIYSEQS
jgi:ribosomal protein S18 acetylase RimI-like enzyme